MKQIEEISFDLKNNFILQAKIKERSMEVYLKRCFPWSHPHQFISVRDTEDKEVFFIQNIDDLPEEERGLLLKQLESDTFVLEITKINSIDDEVEIRKFDVQTDKGHRVFQTMIDYWPEMLNSTDVLINDISGDMYKITNWKNLDFESCKLIEQYID
tara:strand:- start:11807 stop:12277 length:471 start_codon:yes stop_codon:yes gene_type:complete